MNYMTYLLVLMTALNVVPVANAAVTTFTNKLAWQSAAGDITTIKFNDLPADSLVTSQYQSLGVSFTDGADYILKSPTGFPQDGWGLNGAFDEITVSFSLPMTSIAAHFPGGAKFELYDAGKLIYTSPEFGGSGVNFFGGLVSDQLFDTVVIFDPAGGMFLDNLYFGPPIPAPPALALVGVAALLGGRRRRLA